MIERKWCDIIMKDVRVMTILVGQYIASYPRNNIDIAVDRIRIRISSTDKERVIFENTFTRYVIILSAEDVWIKPSSYMYGSDEDCIIERKYINDEAYLFQLSLLEDTFTSEELNEIYTLYDEVQYLRKAWKL